MNLNDNDNPYEGLRREYAFSAGTPSNCNAHFPQDDWFLTRNEPLQCSLRLVIDLDAADSKFVRRWKTLWRRRRT